MIDSKFGKHLNNIILLLRVITEPWSYASVEPFKFGSSDPIYKKIYNKNMDGKKSFMSPEQGLETLVNNDLHALITTQQVHSIETYHCKESCSFLSFKYGTAKRRSFPHY